MKNRFGSVSPEDYYAAAALDREVGAELLARLDLVALKPKRIIEWGWGADKSDLLLQQRYPEAELIILRDFSAISTVDDYSIDLIVANLLLPWCADLKQMLQVWRRMLRPEGLLVLTSLGPDTLQELQKQAIQLPMLIDMHDLGDA
ncbi:MAG: bioC 1, partial [Gammaproteobacteria bacterium]|nr:bioC 1 [Gammaproteobacteria bacterium]